jgi:hypothetical protein
MKTECLKAQVGYGYGRHYLETQYAIISHNAYYVNVGLASAWADGLSGSTSALGTMTANGGLPTAVNPIARDQGFRWMS